MLIHFETRKKAREFAKGTNHRSLDKKVENRGNRPWPVLLDLSSSDGELKKSETSH